MQNIKEIQSFNQNKLEKDLLESQVLINQSIKEQARQSREAAILYALKTEEINEVCNFENKNEENKELLICVTEICKICDPGLKVERGWGKLIENVKVEVYRIVTSFFQNNGMKSKVAHLKTLLANPDISYFVEIVSTWIVEWSRKKYEQIVDLVDKEKENTEKEQSETYEIDKNLSAFQNYLNKNLSAKCPKRSSNHPKRSATESTKTTNIVEPKQLKPLTIYNRFTLYGYIYDELLEYYKIVGIENLDFEYIREIRKRRMNVLGQNEESLKRAADVLMECGRNKDIRNIMREYENNYKEHKECLKKETIEQNEKQMLKEGKKKNLRVISEYIPVNHKKINPKTRSTSLKVDQNNDDVLESEDNVSIPQSEDIYKQVRCEIKLHFLSKNLQNSCRERIKLPSLSKSMEKAHEVTSTIKFPTEGINEVYEKRSIKTLKSPRETLKGMIVKSFLSNKNKNGRTESIWEEKQEKYERYIDNQKKSIEKIDSSRRMVEISGMTSLRRKTNALLSNFRTVQNY